MNLLDRYLLREWVKILVVTALGFPLVVTTFELTDNLDTLLSRGIPPGEIALGYLYGLPDKIFLVLPAAVLFATVFSLSAMNRHSELTAAKANGRSFHRTVLPVLLAAAGATGLGYLLGEWAPAATTRQLELHGEREMRSQNARYNFVYRADRGWVYAVRALEIGQHTMRHLVLEREGTGEEYPTLVVQARMASWSDTTGRWMLRDGRLRVLPAASTERAFAFDSMVQRSLRESPEALLIEPKDPKEMRYAELGRYIEDLERSGGDGRKLRVKQALKVSVPFTCIIIAVFGAPLALTAPRGSGAVGVGLSLAVTVVFLTLIQLSEAIGAGGVLPPVLAAWVPNMLFGAVGAWMLARART